MVKKKIKVKIMACSSLLLILFILSFKAYRYRGDDIEVTKAISESTLTFEVIGDIHNDISNFAKVINDLKEINNKTDALIMNGDVVNEGLEKEYVDIKNLLEENKRLLPENLIWNIGNHEFISYVRGKNSSEDSKECLKLYYKYSQEKRPYHNEWINGYNFISLGSEETYTEDFGCNTPYISKKQEKWLSKRLRERYKKGRPIFVFLHQNLDQVSDYGVDLSHYEDLINILENYPEVIVFTSHTHISTKTIIKYGKGNLNYVNTGAVTNNYSAENSDYIKNNDAEGIYVTVNQNNVTISSRNHSNKAWGQSIELK